MHETDDIYRKLRISRLQARLEMREIERESLRQEIASPLTTAARKAEAIDHRDDLLTELSDLIEELDRLRNS